MISAESESNTPGRYERGKDLLSKLIKERDRLLEAVEGFAWIEGLSNTDFVVELDVSSLGELGRKLVKVSTEINDLVDEINAEAARTGQRKVGMKVARSTDDGALKLQGGLSAD